MTIPEAFVSITSAFQETMLAAKPAGEMESCSVCKQMRPSGKSSSLILYPASPMITLILMPEPRKPLYPKIWLAGLFGTSEVVGKTFLLNHTAYLISGVVRSVSKLAKYAYAQV